MTLEYHRKSGSACAPLATAHRGLTGVIDTPSEEQWSGELGDGEPGVARLGALYGHTHVLGGGARASRRGMGGAGRVLRVGIAFQRMGLAPRVGGLGHARRAERE